MSSPTRDSFIQTIDKFLVVSRMSATRFGYLALGDPNFISDLRNGRDPRLSTVDTAIAFVRDTARGASSKGVSKNEARRNIAARR